MRISEQQTDQFASWLAQGVGGTIIHEPHNAHECCPVTWILSVFNSFGVCRSVAVIHNASGCNDVLMSEQQRISFASIRSQQQHTAP